MRIRKVLLYVAVIGIILVILVPTLAASLHAMPSADDYANAVHIRDLRKTSSNSFKAAAKGFLEGYLEKGYSLIVFVHFLFSPLLYFGLTGVRIAILVINIGFAVSLFFFVRKIMVHVFGDRDMLHTLLLYGVLACCFLGMRFYGEIFFWMTCSFGYLLPISGLLLGIAFFPQACRTGKTRDWVLSALLGAVGAMGSTNVSAMTCGLYALALLLLWINRKPTLPAILTFGTVLFFGIVGLCAPGIYQRHSLMKDPYPPLRLLGQSFLFVYGRIGWLLKTPFSFAAILAAILAARWFSFEKPVPKANLVLWLLVLLLAPTIVMFPMFFGYNLATNEYVSVRSYFVADFSITISFLGLAFCLVAFFKSRIRFRKAGHPWKSALALALLSAVFAAFTVMYYPPGNYTPVKLVNDVASGELARTDRYWRGFLKKCEEAGRRDVYVDVAGQWDHWLPYYVYPYVTEDRFNWVNVCLADFYGLEWIRGETAQTQ